MDIVNKLPTDLLYIILEYLPNRNRERNRIKYLYDKFVYYDPLAYGYLLPYLVRDRYQNIMRKIQQKINEYTKKYIKDFYRRGNKMEILKDLPFFVNCKKCKKIHCQDDYITYNLFKNEMYLFNGYFHSKDYKHKNK